MTTIAVRPVAPQLGSMHSRPSPARSIASVAVRPPIVPLLWLVALCLIGGLSIPLSKIGLQFFPPLLLTTLRYLVAAPFFVWLVLRFPLPSRSALLAMAALGMLGIPIGQVTQILGVERTQASVATILAATTPLFVVLLAQWRLRQPLRLMHLLGLGLALAGVSVIMARRSPISPLEIAATELIGDALMLISALSMALYYVLSAELAQRYPTETVAAWSSLLGTAALAPFAVWNLDQTTVSAGLLGVGVVLYLGVLATVLGLWIWLNALSSLPARIAAGTIYLQPLIGVSVSAAVLGDPISQSFGIGAGLICFGIVLTASRQPQR